jgi:membrane protein YdbS with pleckstrin-like domain
MKRELKFIDATWNTIIAVLILSLSVNVAIMNHFPAWSVVFLILTSMAFGAFIVTGIIKWIMEKEYDSHE